jgi:hypothetical protein
MTIADSFRSGKQWELKLPFLPRYRELHEPGHIAKPAIVLQQTSGRFTPGIIWQHQYVNFQEYNITCCA